MKNIEMEHNADTIWKHVEDYGTFDIYGHNAIELEEEIGVEWLNLESLTAYHSQVACRKYHPDYDSYWEIIPFDDIADRAKEVTE